MLFQLVILSLRFACERSVAGANITSFGSRVHECYLHPGRFAQGPKWSLAQNDWVGAASEL
jgi:hypothetical protein